MKKMFLAILVLLQMMALADLGRPKVACSENPKIIRFSHGFPEKHFMSEQIHDWAKRVEERSQKALKVEIYPMGQLYRDNEVCRAVQMGAIEAGQAYTYTIESALNPAMKLFDIPFLFYTSNDLVKVAKSDIRKQITQATEKKGVKLLAWMPWPMEGVGLILKKPARVPADIKGLVLRSPSSIYTLTLGKWGAAGSYLPGAEVYMALQQGTIQGATVFLVTVHERKLYEAAPYFTYVPLAGMFTIPIINKSFYEKLPADLQKSIWEASKEMEEKSLDAALRAQERVVTFANETGKIKLYFPTKAEMNVWTESKEAVWKEAPKGDKELADLITRSRSLLMEGK